MPTGYHCDKLFKDGITNGNEWYPMIGSMQDWNYLFNGCMEITLELGCFKYPVGSKLSTYWNDNKYSLMVFAAEVIVYIYKAIFCWYGIYPELVELDTSIFI